MRDITSILLGITCILLSFMHHQQRKQIDSLREEIVEYAKNQAEFDSLHLLMTYELRDIVKDIPVYKLTEE